MDGKGGSREGEISPEKSAAHIKAAIRWNFREHLKIVLSKLVELTNTVFVNWANTSTNIETKCCLVVRCSHSVSCLNIVRRCIPNRTHFARTAFVVMALSFHSTIEGLALALEDEASGVWLNTGIVRSILFKRCIWRNLRCHSSSQICHIILGWNGAGV